MSYINCPYCEAEVEINHDDGRGYEEDVKHQQECNNCNKTFVFNTIISFDYEPYKADCLNGGEHDFEPTHTFPIEFTKMECIDCGEQRKPTEEEMAEVKLWREARANYNL